MVLVTLSTEGAQIPQPLLLAGNARTGPAPGGGRPRRGRCGFGLDVAVAFPLGGGAAGSGRRRGRSAETVSERQLRLPPWLQGVGPPVGSRQTFGCLPGAAE